MTTMASRHNSQSTNSSFSRPWRWLTFFLVIGASLYAEFSLPNPSTSTETGWIVTIVWAAVSFVMYYIAVLMCDKMDEKNDIPFVVTGFHIGLYIGIALALFDTNQIGVFSKASLIMNMGAGFRIGPFAVMLWIYMVLFLTIVVIALCKLLSSCCCSEDKSYEPPPLQQRNVPVRSHRSSNYRDNRGRYVPEVPPRRTYRQ